MGKKTIRFSLDGRSIDKAIRELEKYRNEIHRKTELLRKRVAERIADMARDGFSSAVVDDLIVKGGGSEQRMANVTVTVDDGDAMTLVIANGQDAVWVEFGAGVYHNGAAGSSPHPKGGELGFTIGGFGKGMGTKNIWGFYEDGELRLTHGTPSTMPMYRALTSVCSEIAEIAREVFGS